MHPHTQVGVMSNPTVVVRSIIMNQSDDSLLTQVMTVSHSSLTAAQGNLTDVQTPDVYDASHYLTHDTIQS